jgi:chemotaxis protein CheC
LFDVDKLNSLNSFQLDALQELGNIGIGNAATSMSEMLNSQVNIGLTKVLVVPLEQIYEILGENPEEWVTCVSVKYSGDASYHFLFVLEHQSSLDLIDLLLGNNPGTTTELNEMGMSVLKELGNIISGTFATVLSSLTVINFTGSVPMIASDMFSAIINAMVVISGQIDDRFLLFETDFFTGYEKVFGRVMIMPESNFLSKIIGQLGMENIK